MRIDIDGTARITPDEIVTGSYGKVDKETVGQFTGMKDVYGNYVYEQDIVEAMNLYAESYPIVKGIVIYDERYGRYKIITKFPRIGSKYDEYPIERLGLLKIMGNAIENPELLEGE